MLEAAPLLEPLACECPIPIFDGLMPDKTELWAGVVGKPLVSTGNDVWAEAIELSREAFDNKPEV